MTPYRDRSYLDLSYAPGKTCIKCGAPLCEPAHFSGLYSDQLGKGGAQKSADVCVADLCRVEHVAFDNYEMGNDDRRVAEFLLLCWRTLLRNDHDLHLRGEEVTTENKSVGSVTDRDGALLRRADYYLNATKNVVASPTEYDQVARTLLDLIRDLAAALRSRPPASDEADARRLDWLVNRADTEDWEHIGWSSDRLQTIDAAMKEGMK